MYVLTSIGAQQATGPELSRLTWAHWAAIQNGVHRVRDEARKEDALRARQQNLLWVLISFASLVVDPRYSWHQEHQASPRTVQLQPRAALALTVPKPRYACRRESQHHPERRDRAGPSCLEAQVPGPFRDASHLSAVHATTPCPGNCPTTRQCLTSPTIGNPPKQVPGLLWNLFP